MRSLIFIATPALVGCSLIYNPSNLPERNDGGIDSRVDAEVVLDADPSKLELTRVAPTLIFEGTGAVGSRQAVLTVHGKQMVMGARISVAVHGAGPDPLITVADTMTQVADNGFVVAAPITIAVNPNIGAGTKLRLDVTVTQPNGTGGTVTQTLMEAMPRADTPVLELQGFDELNTATATLPTGVINEFSQVTVTGSITAANRLAPLILKSRASMTIGGLVQVNAFNDQPGPGGSPGGAGGPGGVGAGPGAPGMGNGAGAPSGGGGGFGTPGASSSVTVNSGGPAVGTAGIADFAISHGSGGAGGDGSTLGGAGGRGGAGGGVVELTAGGTLSVATLEATGSASLDGNNGGGGGSGGAVLLRGSSVTISGGITITGGIGAGTGGDGGVGRARIDVPSAAAIANSGTAFRGPVLAMNTPLITRDEQPTLTVFGTGSSTYQYFFFNHDPDDPIRQKGPFTPDAIAGNGTNAFTTEKLFRGLNTICLLADGANFANQKPEGQNCFDIVYLFTLP